MAMLADELGFAVRDSIRARMVHVLLDFLDDCEYVRTEPDGTRRWNLSAVPPWHPSEHEEHEICRTFDGQMEFFGQCLAYVGRFLEGAPPLFDFAGTSTNAWERLLGNGEIAYARSVLSRLLLPRAVEGARILVLCYGPGFDLVEIERRRPDARITALDFTNAFFDVASRRLTRPEAVRWVDGSSWKGFGSPLPFDDGWFDVVLFACADPYIPPAVRVLAYEDIHRVMRAGAVLGVLTHSYPDKARLAVAESWIRRGTYCHDFLESVCQGWQGFYDAAATRALFTQVGFGLDVVTLNASVWRLQKPGTR